MNRQDLTLLTDLYELTMMQGYYEESQNEVVIFDVFFRQNPCNNGYSVCAGLAQVIDYIKNLNFTYEDVDYLRSLKIFSEAVSYTHLDAYKRQTVHPLPVEHPDPSIPGL